MNRGSNGSKQKSVNMMSVFHAPLSVARRWINKPIDPARSVNSRPWKLLGVSATTAAAVLLMDAINGFRLTQQMLFPVISHPGDAQFWSARVYALALVLGLPVAFFLWHWRDRNVRDQIENSRKDITLKEFQEVQARAAGLFDEKMPESARQQLQIAALHQLRGFLRGEYGDSFRRPAFELLLAGHAEAMERIGMREVRRQISEGESKPDWRQCQRIGQAMRDKLDPVMRERIGIIRDEAKAIFDSGFPLNGRRFDLCTFNSYRGHIKWNLSGASFAFADFSSMNLEGAVIVDAELQGVNLAGSNLEKTNMMHSILCGAFLSQTNFQGANLAFAKMQGASLTHSCLDFADISEANLENADLSSAHLNKANFFDAQMVGAKLYRAHLEGSNLSDANLEGANGRRAHLKGANLTGVNLQNANFRGANLQETDLSMARLESANLTSTELQGAHLWGATRDGARFYDAIFDDATIVLCPGDEYSVKANQSAHDELRVLGARHVDDPEPVG